MIIGTQYFSLQNDKSRHLRSETIPKEWQTQELPLICEAGTVVLIHYDVWHAAMSNFSEQKLRYMFKFQFVRMQQPTKPTWNIGPSTDWPYPDTPSAPLNPLWRSMWNWLCGVQSEVAGAARMSEEETKGLKEKLYDSSVGGDVWRLEAAYSLAHRGRIDILRQALLSEDEAIFRTSAYGLAAAGPQAVPILVEHLKSKLGMNVCFSYSKSSSSSEENYHVSHTL